MKTSDIPGPIIVAVIFALPITIFTCAFYYCNYYNRNHECEVLKWPLGAMMTGGVLFLQLKRKINTTKLVNR